MTARSLPLVGSRLFAGLPTPSLCYSGNAGLAAWVRIVAGQVRLLHEMVTGQPVADPDTAGNSETPCAPPAPGGGLGERHTGAGHGRPIKHTLLSVAYPAGDNMPAPPSGVTNRTSPTLQRDAFPPAGTINGKLILEYAFAVPHCWPGGCYETAQLAVGIYCSQAAASSSATVTAYTTAGGWADGDGVLLDSYTTTATGYTTDTGTITLKPGERNQMRLVVDVSNGYDVTIQVAGVAVSQVLDA